MGALRVVLWKEVLDLARDYKTIAYVVILPLIVLPGLSLFVGGLYSAQSISVAVVDLDGGPSARFFLERLRGELGALQGVNVEFTVTSDVQQALAAHVAVVIPEGFSEALASLDGTAVIGISRQAGVVAVDQVVQAVLRAAGSLEADVVESRVERLAGLAGVEVDPQSLLNPIQVTFQYHTVGGAPAGERAGAITMTSRVLIFSLFFVVNPAIVFMSDAIVGERERRTIEKLLASPAPLRDIILGKGIASVALSAVAALADSAALVLFFYLSGLEVAVSAPILAAWIASAALLVLSTTALSAVIAARSESIRSAQAGSAVLTIIAIIIFSSALAVDYSSLPGYIQVGLQLIPFTHAALAVYYAALGDIVRTALHVAVQAGLAALLSLAAARLMDPERLVRQS